MRLGLKLGAAHGTWPLNANVFLLSSPLCNSNELTLEFLFVICKILNQDKQKEYSGGREKRPMFIQIWIFVHNLIFAKEQIYWVGREWGG